MSIAHAYPGVRVDGVDLHAGSIEAAQRLAATEGVTDRVTFEVRDAATLAGADYDAALMFEMVARPGATGGGASAGARGGRRATVWCWSRDEPVGDAYVGPHPDERRYYGYSVLHCLPASMTEPDSAATGTVMRPDTLRRYADEAGFASVEILPVESVAFRLYLLRP